MICISWSRTTITMYTFTRMITLVLAISASNRAQSQLESMVFPQLLQRPDATVLHLYGGGIRITNRNGSSWLSIVQEVDPSYFNRFRSRLYATIQAENELENPMVDFRAPRYIVHTRSNSTIFVPEYFFVEHLGSRFALHNGDVVSSQPKTLVDTLTQGFERSYNSVFVRYDTSTLRADMQITEESAHSQINITEILAGKLPVSGDEVNLGTESLVVVVERMVQGVRWKFILPGRSVNASGLDLGSLPMKYAELPISARFERIDVFGLKQFLNTFQEDKPHLDQVMRKTGCFLQHRQR
jgi:hypothetical protein